MGMVGVVMLLIGAMLVIAEAHFPAVGVAGGLGVVMGAVGAVLAVGGAGGGLWLGLLAALALLSCGGVLLTISVRKGSAAARRQVRTGAEGIVGHIGRVQSWADSGGRVLLDGTVWRASRSVLEEGLSEPRAGDQVVVERLTGLTLTVRQAEDWELPG
jgi:membrane-bound ClpP family serine protease